MLFSKPKPNESFIAIDTHQIATAFILIVTANIGPFPELNQLQHIIRIKSENSRFGYKFLFQDIPDAFRNTGFPETVLDQCHHNIYMFIKDPVEFFVVNENNKYVMEAATILLTVCAARIHCGNHLRPYFMDNMIVLTESDYSRLNSRLHIKIQTPATRIITILTDRFNYYNSLVGNKFVVSIAPKQFTAFFKNSQHQAFLRDFAKQDIDNYMTLIVLVSKLMDWTEKKLVRGQSECVDILWAPLVSAEILDIMEILINQLPTSVFNPNPVVKSYKVTLKLLRENLINRYRIRKVFDERGDTADLWGKELFNLAERSKLYPPNLGFVDECFPNGIPAKLTMK